MNIDNDEDVKKHGAFYYIFWSVAAAALLWLNYDFLYAHLSSNAEKVNNYVPQYDELEKYELPAVASWFYLEKAQEAGQDTGYYFGSGYKRQNNKYYYAQFVFGFAPRVGDHLFYRKSDGKSFFFRQTTEGVILNPMYFCDDFLLSLASYEDMEAYKHVLDEQEFAKLKGRTEEDNPFLVKCYFK